MSVSDCSIDVLYVLDSGVYWCESAAGECSESINITVTGGPVILESPVHPVDEGDNVTLGCRQKTSSSSSNFTAQFYREGLLIGSSSTGTLTISSVSKDDQGLYKCNVSGAGQSPDAWLVVRGAEKTEKEHHFDILQLVLPVAVVGLFLVAVMLLCLWRRHKGKVDPAVSYTDITIIEGGGAKMTRGRSFARTFYSKVKPETPRQEAAARPNRQNKRS